MLELPPHEGFYVWIVIFFVFSALMKPLILAPIQKLLEEREERTTGAQAEADHMRDEAAEMEAEFERQIAQARLAGSSAGEDVRREAEAKEREILEAARSDAARTVGDVRTRIECESEQARAALQGDTGTLAKLVAEKVLGRAVNS